jgi:hypothetical protein
MKLAEYACRVERMHGLYISLTGDAKPEEYLLAAPYLRDDANLRTSLQIHGFALLLFKNSWERDLLYNQTVGDDGPTRDNRYKGPAKVYAAKIDNNGYLFTENT